MDPIQPKTGTSIATAQQPGGSDYVPTALTPQSLSPATPINIPPPTTPDTTHADQVVGGAEQTSKSVSDYIKANTPDPSLTPENTAAKGLYNDISTLLGQDTGKGAYTAGQETTAGLPDMNKQLGDLNAQLKTQTAEYNTAYKLLEGQGRGITTGIIGRQQSALRNQQAADISMTQARIAGVQGNIQVAQQNVQRAVDLKYKDIEDQIAQKETQLQLITPFLNAEQTKTAAALVQKNADEKQALADKKAKETTNLNTAITAGVSTNFVNQNGKFFDARTGQEFSDPASFYKAAGVTSFAEAYQKGLVSDVNGSTQADRTFVAQARAKYPDVNIPANATPAQAAQAIKGSGIYQKETYIAPPAGTTVPGSPGGQSITNDVQAILEGRNTMYNIRQTMGRTNAAAAYMQQVRDKITAVDPNFDFVASDAGGKSVSTSYVQKATAAINSVLPNIDTVVNLSNQVGRIGIKGVDALLQKGQTQINNKKVSNFHEAQQLIADEIGVALGAGTVSDMKLQLGFDVTDPTVSAEVFASNMGIVKEFIQNRKAGLDSLRYHSSTTDNSSAPTGPPPDGQIWVKDKTSGAYGSVPTNEYDPSKYDKVSFNSVGNTSASVDKTVAAIGQYESGGNYKAIGPKTSSGDFAYGKYQVMGANIPQWTKAALGHSLTPQQFLGDPKAQDAVAMYKIGDLIAQGHNVEDVASIWFTGKPLAQGANRKDVIGTSGSKYAQAIRSIYNKS